MRPRPSAPDDKPGETVAPAERAPAPSPSKRVPLRRRAMPCPHCDAELPLGLVGEREPHCPRCELPLMPVEVAGFWRRSAAALIDLGVLALTAGPIAWGLHRLMAPLPLAPGARGLDLLLTVGATDLDLLLLRAGPFLVMAACYVLLMVVWRGRTLGQRLLAVRIVDRHGQPPNLLAAALRTLAQFVGILAAALGPLWIAFDAEKRAFHDHIAGTYVVRSA